MSKRTPKKTVKKIPKDVWFYPVRGSYLPRGWQAWSLYFIFTAYILGPLVVDLTHDRTFFEASLRFINRILISGIILTWVAQKKS